MGGRGDILIYDVIVYSMCDIMADEKEHELETLEFEQIIEDVRNYVIEKDGLEAMTMWVRIQKRINAFRKKKIQGF